MHRHAEGESLAAAIRAGTTDLSMSHVWGIRDRMRSIDDLARQREDHAMSDWLQIANELGLPDQHLDRLRLSS